MREQAIFYAVCAAAVLAFGVPLVAAADYFRLHDVTRYTPPADRCLMLPTEEEDELRPDGGWNLARVQWYTLGDGGATCEPYGAPVPTGWSSP